MKRPATAPSLASIGLGLLLAAGCASPPAPQRLLIAVGDSITAGYMSVDGTVQLRQDLSHASRLGTGWRVVNVAIPGYTTEQATGWPIETTRGLVPAATVVMLGTNDALRALPIEGSKAAMRKILDAFPKGRLVVVTPPFAGDAHRAWQLEWNAFLRTEAGARGAGFVDAYTPGSKGEWLCAPPDVHPCANGHAAIAALVSAQLAAAAP